jgi:hypothetical protein
MFDMANDSHLFRRREELEAEGFRLEGNVFVRGAERYLPLYEAKMIDQFDHRAADVVISPTAQVRQRQPRYLSDSEKADPTRLAFPQSWVAEAAVTRKLQGRWAKSWLLGFAGITSWANERTVIAAVIPRAGVGNNYPLVLVRRSKFAPFLGAVRVRR